MRVKALAGAGDGQMSRVMTRKKVDERATQCSHQHNEEDEGLDGDCSMMDCYDLLSVSDLFGPVWTRIPTASMAHSVAMKIALFSCF